MFLTKIKEYQVAIFLIMLLFTFAYSKAQETSIITGVPFLQVAADARAAGMGDQGVASSADAFSQQWNPAKYAFANNEHGFSVSYTPYLTDLSKDIALAQLTYHSKINERSAFATSLRYFGLGDITLRQTGAVEEQSRIVAPNEFAFDGSYSLKLTETFSMAVAGRYISSNLKAVSGNGNNTAASSFAFDLAGFYQSEEIAYNQFNGRWRAGFNFQNLGPKISYDDDQISTNFLPANLKIGAGFDFIMDAFNKVTLNIELNKLLVPTPQNSDLNGDGTIASQEMTQNQADYRSINWISGVFKSFNDAPNGFSEELREVTYAAGAEYSYLDSFAMRLGYFHENATKGARRFFSLGSGFKYNVVKVDVSYLFSASKVKNPLDSTLRFSLTFNFGDTIQN